MSESEKSTSSPFAVALQNFASQWFLIPQGTGIIAIVLHQLDYQFQGLRIVADIFWLLTIASLLLMLAAYCTRILLYPKQVRAALQSNISEAACLSCIVIAFTTIIIMTALTSVRLWSSKWGTVVFVLWWINVALAVASSIGTPYAFAHIEHPGTTKVTPTIFMPTVCGATTAVGGAIICRYGALTNHEQVPVIIVSYLLLGLVLPLTIAYDALFLARSFEGNLPNEQQVYQIFILCGPLSQGSYALQVLGDVVSRGPFAGYGRGLFLTQSAAMPIAYASEFAGLIMWGYATFWWGFAIVSVVFDFISKAKAKGGIRKMEFSLSAWSVVFPWVGESYVASYHFILTTSSKPQYLCCFSCVNVFILTGRLH